MDPENVINLFDSYWFDYEILKNNTSSYSAKKTNKLCSSSSEPKFLSLRSILVRSKSEDVGSSFNFGSFSPISVPFTSNLKSITSGKLDFKIEKPEQKQEPETETANTDKRVLLERKKSRRTNGTSKSLSELEFEELKGFMDLGFVFSEKDKDDSSLVEIIPGLQRLGEERESKDSYSCSSTSATSRPYLSEAWKDLDRKLNYKELMMNWEIPAVKDEIDMKDNLKLWAHTVASFVT